MLIFGVSGSIDPWHALSVLQTQDKDNEIAIFIKGTAHCANMEATRKTDPPQLTEARQVNNLFFSNLLETMINKTSDSVTHYPWTTAADMWKLKLNVTD